jgi:putative PIN family toxin of toxin-antitoxin system
MKVVIDTIVLVSGILTKRGNEAAVLDLVAAGELTWCVSEQILAEYRRVLLNKLQFDPAHVERYLNLAEEGHVSVPPAGSRSLPMSPTTAFTNVRLPYKLIT